MLHFVAIAPPLLSHVRALEAVADELARRGHRTTLLHQADAAALRRSPALGFRAVGAASHPPGSLAVTVARAARPGGPVGLLRVIHDLSRTTDMLCREAPAALRELGADAVIADQMEAAGGLVAEHLGLPFVSLAAALPINREPLVPLPYLPWGYDPSPWGERLNRGGEQVSGLLMREHGNVIERHAAAFGLKPRRGLADCLSPLAQLGQTVAGFDFPRRALTPVFHHLGPLRPPAAAEPALGLTLRDDRPFVFASLGTLQGHRLGLFRKIAAACRALDLQLLIAHCGGLSAEEAASLESEGCRVTDFAPQRAALARAAVAVTHAGLNTALDALAAGVPMLALPIAFDQPGVAARIVRAGAGLRLGHRTLTVGRVRAALARLLAEPAFRQSARALGREVAGAGGVMRAAEIVERAVRTGRPVTAASLAMADA